MKGAIGFCPGCGHKIMVQDTKGNWTSRKPNHMEVDFVYPDGTRVRCATCKKCMKDPNWEELIGGVTSEGSQLADAKVKQMIKDKGLPTGFIVRRG